jgi:enoyl-CoA hydratase
VPVVAALNGDAMGGGAELAMACDFRIAAAHARIGFVQGQLSLSTAWGGGIDLMQRLGPSAALGILGRSQMLSGGDALREGLLDAVASPGRPLDELAHEFLAPFVRQAPQVLRAFKALAIASRRGVPRSELCELEAGRFADLWVHDDHWQAVDRLVAGSRKR